MKGFFGILIFLGGIALGFQYASQSWNGERFISFSNISMNPKRDLAAVKKVFDFSNHVGNLLSSLSSQKLIANAELTNDEGYYWLSLGHYVLKTKTGDNFLACQLYDKVTIEYMAEGEAQNGQAPKMEVVGDCNIVSDDINHIAPIRIPAKEILANAPGDGEFNFNDAYHVSVRFYNVSGQWPKQWALKGVTLSDSNKEQLETSVLAKQSPRVGNLNMDWTRL